MSEVSLAGTDELLENRGTDVILATGGTAMVRAAYSKGKPAYGVGSGNVPVYVDRSADIRKAAKDIVYGASFDWGTLCSTERSIVADVPISAKLKQALKEEKAYFLNEDEKAKLRRILWKDRGLNVDQVGQSPARIASLAGFSVPADTRALVAEVTVVGKEEPLSMETLSPILSYFEEDGWQSGCSRCIDVLKFGGIGHTLCLHCTNERIIEEFALTKPSMRIVVNTVAALGSVGYTNRLFPAMTLGPGTIGGSITSDNISPMHLLNIKRLAFETNPIHPPSGSVREAGGRHKALTATAGAADSPGRERPSSGWIDTIEERLRARAGSISGNGGRPTTYRTAQEKRTDSPPGGIGGRSKPQPVNGGTQAPEKRSDSPRRAASKDGSDPGISEETAKLPLPEDQIQNIIKKFKK
jgi:acetaldehyde dehydrogenase (acetylating)